MGYSFAPDERHSLWNTSLYSSRNDQIGNVRQQSRCLVSRSSNILTSLRNCPLWNQIPQWYLKDSLRLNLFPKISEYLCRSNRFPEGMPAKAVLEATYNPIGHRPLVLPPQKAALQTNISLIFYFFIFLHFHLPILLLFVAYRHHLYDMWMKISKIIYYQNLMLLINDR